MQLSFVNTHSGKEYPHSTYVTELSSEKWDDAGTWLKGLFPNTSIIRWVAFILNFQEDNLFKLNVY